MACITNCGWSQAVGVRVELIAGTTMRSITSPLIHFQCVLEIKRVYSAILRGVLSDAFWSKPVVLLFRLEASSFGSYNMAEQHCEEAFFGCQRTVIDNRNAKQKKVVDNRGKDYSSTLMVGCRGVRQDDSGANIELEGTGNGSLRLQRIERGTDITFKEENTKKLIRNQGGPNTETGILSAVNGAKVKIDSKNSMDRVEATSAPGSMIYGSEVGENSTLTVNEEDKICEVIAKDAE